MSYEELLAKAPAHDSPEFLDFLKEHNVVVWENPQWLVIENCKYHTADRHWFTAFWKTHPILPWYFDMDILWEHFGQEWQDKAWLKKSASKQTVNRFHMHIYDDD